MPVFEITLKRAPGLPRSRRIARLNYSFKQGKTETTTNMALVAYAKSFPDLFMVVKASAKDGPQKAPIHKPTPEPEQMNATEAWIDMMASAPKSGPKNGAIKEFADEYEIELGDATKKSEMIEVIEAALE